MELLLIPFLQTVQENFFLTFRALSQLNIIVLLTFTLSPFDLSVPFLVSSVPFKPSDDSMLTNTESSARNSSFGHPDPNFLLCSDLHLQSFIKYLRQTLVFMCNSALWEN